MAIPDALKDLASNGVNENLKFTLRAHYADSFNEFVSIVNDIVDFASSLLRSKSHISFDSKNMEDGLTSQFRLVLESHGLRAAPSHQRGNVDMCIEPKNHKNYKVIVEAKILGGKNDYSNLYLMKGMHQLCTRYDVGGKENDYSIFLVYNLKDRNKTRLDDWRKFLFENATDEFYPKLGTCSYLGSVGKNEIITTHLHFDTEEQMFVRNVFIPLNFNPQDRRK